jgi:hypothetical protein
VSLRTLRVFGLNPATTQKQLMKRLQKVATAEAVALVSTEEAATLGGGKVSEGGVWPRGGMARVAVATIKDASKVMAVFDRKTLHGSVRYYFFQLPLSSHLRLL